MTDRPLLFSAPMVRSLLDDSKTQTRRIMKHEHIEDIDLWAQDGDRWECGVYAEGSSARMGSMRCPHGVPGDRIWVKETWGFRGTGWSNKRPGTKEVSIEYRADASRRTVIRQSNDEAGIPRQHVPAKFAGVRRGSECETAEQFDLSCGYDEWMRRWWKSWRPSIFMPRWASRITLDLLGVRVERLNEISEEDAKAEGVRPLPPGGPNRWTVDWEHGSLNAPTAVETYRLLWEAINGEGSWAANPWVWVLEFRRATP